MKNIAEGSALAEDDGHPLKRELYALVRESREIFEFLQDGCLDGLWYLDLDDNSSSWVSPRFKEVFGYAGDDAVSLTDISQTHMVEDDVERATLAFVRHCHDPSVPYDEILRYRHRYGSIVWIRCRGLAIRDVHGKPVRMLGAHTDITALKNAEEERARVLAEQEAQRQVAVLIEGLPQLIWTCDAQGSCDYVSQRWIDYTGTPREQQLGRGWSVHVHPDDRPRITELWQVAFATGRELVVEYRLRRHDGAYRWFDARALPLRDAQGQIVRWVGSSTDVHEAYETREALKREQARWSKIVATSPGVVISFHIAPDQSVSFPYVSPGAVNEFGLQADELTRDPLSISRRIHEQDFPALVANVNASAESICALRHEFRYQHPTRGERWISVHFMPTRDHDGGTSWAGIAVDVTSEKQRERELTTLKSQLDSALEAADMGAYVLDLEQLTMWESDTLRRLFGYHVDVPEVHPAGLALEIVHPADRERIRMEARAAFATSSRMLFEFRIQRPADGVVRWMSCRARIERAPDGRALRVVGVTADITQQRTTAEAQARSHKLEALGTLAGGIAHDFNNVLQVIAGRAGLALGELPAASSARQHVLEIAHAGMRGSELVARILSFSRPKDQSRASVELGGAVQEALKLLRPTIPASIDVRFAQHGQVAPVMADSTEVHQLVVNLVTNASHAIGRAQGRITLELERVTLDEPASLSVSELPAGSYARLSVRDDGTGMDAGTLARVFDPYFTTKPVGEGTGLGLAVVSSIMRSLGGGVLVASDKGRGTIFQLLFREATREAPSRPESPRMSLPRGEGQRLLFVDDEPTLAVLGRDTLRFLGYAPDAFSDPEQAVAAFVADPHGYAAVITDLTMPRMSGFELAAIVRAHAPHVPVLMMSGYARPEERERATAAGVAQFMHKPLALADLANLLHELLSAD